MADESTDTSKADIGIVTGLPIELRPFLNRCHRVRKYSGNRLQFHGGRFEGLRIVIVESGRGLNNAARATSALIDGHSPEWILSSGLSGSCIDDLSIGNIVVANKVKDAAGNAIDIDIKMQDSAGLKVGHFVSTKEFTRLIENKRAFAEQLGAIACDTESYAVANVCKERSIRFMGVRSISDDLSQDLPGEVLSVIGNTGSMRLGAAMKSVWKRPGSVKDMWNLRENAASAADRLADFLEGVIDQLAGTLK